MKRFVDILEYLSLDERVFIAKLLTMKLKKEITVAEVPFYKMEYLMPIDKLWISQGAFGAMMYKLYWLNEGQPGKVKGLDALKVNENSRYQVSYDD